MVTNLRKVDFLFFAAAQLGTLLAHETGKKNPSKPGSLAPFTGQEGNNTKVHRDNGILDICFFKILTIKYFGQL